MSLSTPVGFLIFNRPDLTARVFAAIAQAKPKQLFVIADGPRSPAEVEKCEQTRAIVQQVDWDCEVKTDFSEVNLGCGRREASGFDWVFSQVEAAIFLEDDTLPSPSFFGFCEAMLERYRHDTRIMHINGDNSVNQDRTNDSYYFSKYIHGWGWASWRRAWQHYDYQMKTWPDFQQAGLIKDIFDDPYEQKFWTEMFEQMYVDPQVVDTWDFQWMYACLAQSGLSIAPSKNLISNLGFNRPDAVHTQGDDPRARLPTGEIDEIEHPQFMVVNQAAERHSFEHLFGGQKMRAEDRPLRKLRRKLSAVKQKLLVGT